MRLSAHRFIEHAKITDYLLNREHPAGAAKARFFHAHGFDRARPTKMMDAIAAHPDRNQVTRTTRSHFGEKFVVECNLETPDGRNPCIRTVWMRLHGSTLHRLVTAYPLP